MTRRATLLWLVMATVAGALALVLPGTVSGAVFDLTAFGALVVLASTMLGTTGRAGHRRPEPDRRRTEAAPSS